VQTLEGGSVLHHRPQESGPVVIAPLRIGMPHVGRWKLILKAVGVKQHGQTKLLEVAGAVGAARRFACRLNGRQQHGDQDADDGDHYQQFDESKAGSMSGVHGGLSSGSNQSPGSNEALAVASEASLHSIPGRRSAARVAVRNCMLWV